MNKLFGSAGKREEFLKQPAVISQLMPYTGQFTPTQQRKIVKAKQSGSEWVLKPTVSQRGDFIGSRLASIGIPMSINALTGKGLQTGPPPSTPSNGLVKGLQVDPPGYYQRQAL